MNNIRLAKEEALGRIAEIYVYNNRMNYYPIFKDIKYSFSYLNVLDVSKEFLEEKDFLGSCFVFEDEVVKGFVWAFNKEIRKLYVDPFFQNDGIGTKLLSYAKDSLDANHLLVLEKNKGARRFYERNGFREDGNKQFEEGTEEYLLHYVR